MLREFEQLKGMNENIDEINIESKCRWGDYNAKMSSDFLDSNW